MPRASVVSVAALLRQPGGTMPISLAFPFDDAGELDDEALPSYATRIEADAEVRIEGELQHASGALSLVAKASAPWRGECRRCTAEVLGTATADLLERFMEPGAAARDADAYEIVDDQVDLGEVARDNLLLAIPLAPLCAEDCRGLCGECYADLNEGPCPHHPLEP